MQIFLSYPSEDRPVAESINLALRDQGHEVFFDREELPPGEEFHDRIRHAIERADLVIFLVGPEALDPGSYTLNEIDMAEKSFPRPSGRVLPVMLRPVALDRIPPYLKAVTLLQTDGSVPAAVADAVYRIALKRKRKRMLTAASSTAAALLAAGVVYLLWAQHGPTQERMGKDGAPAVLVPAGSFTMGDDEEAPQRQIYLGAFYLDRYEITTGRYAKFLKATGSVRPPLGWETLDLARGSDLPVTGVDWRDADAYCRWTGRRLPTEAEWEKGARGTDARRYPWGDASPTLDHANYQNASPSAYDGGLAAVGSHPAGMSPYGIDDLAGNAAEWVADWYAEAFPANDVRDPKGPANGSARVIRGGGRFDPAERIKAAKRWYASPDTQGEDIGFRCARDP